MDLTKFDGRLIEDSFLQYIRSETLPIEKEKKSPNVFFTCAIIGCHHLHDRAPILSGVPWQGEEGGGGGAHKGGGAGGGGVLVQGNSFHLRKNIFNDLSHLRSSFWTTMT